VILEELLMFIHQGSPHPIFPAAFFSFTNFFFRSKILLTFLNRNTSRPQSPYLIQR
jgi:hypothetical protein